jgi:competence protein ComEC
MLTRDRLWQRLAGEGFWPLAWALAGACLLPWALPESWDGRCPAALAVAGWGAVLAAAPLVRSRRWIGLPLALTLAWGTVAALGRQARWERALPTGFQRLEGVLASPWRRRGASLGAELRLTAPAALAGTVVALTVPAQGRRPPAPGTPVAVPGELEPVAPAPDFLAERPLWRARSDGVARRLHLRSALLLEPLGPARPPPLLRLRVAVQERFEALPLAPGPARDLWGALTLGLPPVDGECFSPFAESGTIHTLVVSGLQVTLVLGCLEALWRRLFGRGSCVAGIVFGALYCAVVGFSAPVWRGLLMGAAWALARASGWRLPAALALHGALLAWLLAHPAAGCEPGFLLAWLALIGLLWASEPLAGLCAPVLGRQALAFARVLAPWLTTLPLLALFHGGAPLWGVPANLVLLPLVLFLAPVGLLLVLAPLPWAVRAVAGVLGWAGGELVPRFARVLPLATDPAWPWGLLALGWILLAQRHGALRRSRWLCATLVAATAILLVRGGLGGPAPTLSLEAIDVGQGDALLLRVPGGDATLVDTGPDPRAARRIVRVLSRRGVREPLHLILSHPHLDHAGGWATLARLWPLRSTALPATARPEAWRAFGPESGRAATAGAGATTLLRGDRWRRGEAAFSVRWPPKPLALRDPNMLSAVLRVRWRGRELWLMGDALAVQEQDLLDLGEPGPARPRLLKAGHHGSRSASSAAFAAALAPDLALITAGRRNAFDHPHPESLAALEAAGARCFVTGACLGLRVSVEPGAWLLETGDGQRLRFATAAPGP